MKSVDAVETYIVALVAATRRPAEFGDKLKGWITIGASPRGSLALDRSSRVHAWLHGRDHVTPEDVQAIAHDCLRHRVIADLRGGGRRHRQGPGDRRDRQAGGGRGMTALPDRGIVRLMLERTAMEPRSRT